MSLRTLVAVWDGPEEIAGTDLLVLLALADFADDDGGSCFPTVGRLAGRCRVSERTVQRSLRHLEGLGYIARLPDDALPPALAARRADRRPTAWQLHVDRLTGRQDDAPNEGEDATPNTGRQNDTPQPSTGRQDDTPQPHGVTSGASRGDTGVAHGVTPVSPYPSVEQPVEPPSLPDAANGAASVRERESEDDRVVDAFEKFWEAYPSRHGKKVGKRAALIEWRKLTWEQRRRAYRGAQNLAAADTLPKDPERFLRRSKGGRGDYPFDDWQDAAAAVDDTAWRKALDELAHAVRTVGSYRSPSWDDIDPVVREWVRSVGGWRAVCNMPLNEGWVRAQFRDYYRQANLASSTEA